MDPNVKASARHYENITWYPGRAIADKRKQAYFDAIRLGPMMRIWCNYPQVTTLIIVYYFSGDKVTSEMSVLLRRSNPVRSGSQQLEEGTTIDQSLSQLTSGSVT